MAVDRSDRAAEKGHGNKDGREHEGNSDERASNLGHGLPCGFEWGEPFLSHNALHIFDDDDGIIHENANRENHAEHGQHVNGESKGEHGANVPRSATGTTMVGMRVARKF